MANPKVSIVCNFYNHANYAEKAILSFLEQKTNFEVEILLHDDCSDDETPSIIRKYEFEHPDKIKPIYQKENQGKKGVNNWIEYQFPRAKGKYIALCDGDDYWTDPLKLQKQVDFLEEHPDCSITGSNALILNQCDNSISSFYKTNIFLSFNDLLCKNHLITCTVVFRNLSINFSKEDLKIIYGDWMLYLNILFQSKGKAHISEDTYAVYREHSLGVTKLYSTEVHNVGMIDFIEACVKKFKINPTSCQKIKYTTHAINLCFLYFSSFRIFKTFIILIRHLRFAKLSFPILSYLFRVYSHLKK